MDTKTKKIIRWLLDNDAGVSAWTLSACLCGIPPSNICSLPRDRGDFGICRGFLDILSPEDKTTALRNAAAISKEWEALVKQWDLLERMYDSQDGNLFLKMHEIIRSARE